MRNLKGLISEQDELNTYIEEKIEALRKHQNFLNEFIPEELVKNGLTYTKSTGNKNLHIFTYSELEVKIEVKNPVDEKIPLSEATGKRLEINIFIKRKMNALERNYKILDRTKYKTEYKTSGIHRYSIHRNEDAETDLMKVFERVFEHELKQAPEDDLI